MLTPDVLTAHTAPARSLASAGPALTWQERRQAALDARTLRSHGVDPLDHIDEKALGERIRAAGAIGILVTHSREAAATADRILQLTPDGLQE